jgi:hypothetical protein
MVRLQTSYWPLTCAARRIRQQTSIAAKEIHPHRGWRIASIRNARYLALFVSYFTALAESELEVWKSVGYAEHR